MEKASDGARVRFPPPLIYVAGLALGVAADRFGHLPRLGLPLTLRDIAGFGLVVAGFAVSFAGAGLFMRRGTAIIPYKPATQLVTSGIYSWTRNPMYLGMALIYAGVAIFMNSLAALVLLPLVLMTIQTQVIAPEEAYLERAFGDDYVAYKKRVRAWI
jgi:protein-S-isoprenylcysteine O-methyltransferase Ste14